MALQLDVEPVIEQRLQVFEHMCRCRNLTGQQQTPNPAARAAGEGKKASAIAFEL